MTTTTSTPTGALVVGTGAQSGQGGANPARHQIAVNLGTATVETSGHVWTSAFDHDELMRITYSFGALK